MSDHVYFAKQTINKDNYLLNVDPERLHHLCKQKCIESLSQYIEENVKEEQRFIPELNQDVLLFTVAILPVDEYKRLKEIEEQNDYLEDRLNIIRHELTKEYDMYDIETKMEIITSIIHDYYAN